MISEILRQFIQEIYRNVLASRTHSNHREGSGSVTWRDLTLCHGISEAQYYPVLPDAIGKVISE
eukprot:1391252-Amorphochlora_amoeboformis.AAC.1